MRGADKRNCRVNYKIRLRFVRVRVRWCIALLVLPLLSSCELLGPRHQAADLSSAVHEKWSDWEQDSVRSHDEISLSEAALALQLDTDADQHAAADPLAMVLDVSAVKAPIESVLFALTADVGVGLHIRQALVGNVTLRAQGQNLKTVLDLLSQQITMHWQLKAGRLDVWGSEPFTHSYAVDYLNLDRTTLSSVGLATQVGSINANPGEGSTTVTNSSETLIRNQALHRFWDSLAADLEGLRSQFTQPSTLNDSVSVMSYTINRDAGLVTLFADAKVHQLLERYLGRLSDSVRRQVVIEATVVEVTLSDQFQAGVDWQFLADGESGLSGVQKLLGAGAVNTSSADRLSTPSALFSLVQKSSKGNMRATLSLLQQFGDVRILSRPRIIALNNQSSVLKVVDNRVYFTLNIERKSSDTKDQISTQSEIHTVPVGLVMNVTPFIGADNEVMLNVRPSLSRIIGFVNDPNPELAQANVRNGVPEIQVREMESMLRVKSGELAVIGGLMQDVVEDNQRELPGLSRLPGIGSLFSSKERNRRQTELLVVLRPTVMPNFDPPPRSRSGSLNQ